MRNTTVSQSIMHCASHLLHSAYKCLCDWIIILLVQGSSSIPRRARHSAMALVTYSLSVRKCFNWMPCWFFSVALICSTYCTRFSLVFIVKIQRNLDRSQIKISAYLTPRTDSTAEVKMSVCKNSPGFSFGFSWKNFVRDCACLPYAHAVQKHGLFSLFSVKPLTRSLYISIICDDWRGQISDVVCQSNLWLAQFWLCRWELEKLFSDDCFLRLQVVFF